MSNTVSREKLITTFLKPRQDAYEAHFAAKSTQAKNKALKNLVDGKAFVDNVAATAESGATLDGVMNLEKDMLDSFLPKGSDLSIDSLSRLTHKNFTGLHSLSLSPEYLLSFWSAVKSSGGDPQLVAKEVRYLIGKMQGG